MARDFDGVTDRIDYANISNLQSVAQSFSFNLTLRSTVVSSQYYFLDHLTGDAANALLVGTSSAADDTVELIQYTDAIFTSRRGAAGLVVNTRAHMTITWDGSQTATGIKVYKNGVETSYSSPVNGTGTPIAATGSMSLAGRIYDDNRCADCELSEFGRWDRILDIGEINALGAGAYTPDNFLDGLVRYAPLVRTANDLLNGAASTVDGSTVVTHPRVTQRRSRRISSPANRQFSQASIIG